MDQFSVSSQFTYDSKATSFTLKFDESLYKLNESLSKWRTFFPVHSKFSRTLSKWRINDQKVRHFDKRPIILEFSKWRTFIGRSYQNGELFESEILVARSSLLVIC